MTSEQGTELSFLVFVQNGKAWSPMENKIQDTESPVGVLRPICHKHMILMRAYHTRGVVTYYGCVVSGCNETAKVENSKKFETTKDCEG